MNRLYKPEDESLCINNRKYLKRRAEERPTIMAAAAAAGGALILRAGVTSPEAANREAVLPGKRHTRIIKIIKIFINEYYCMYWFVIS